MPRKAASAYVEFKRRITSKFVIDEVNTLCNKWGGISAQDAIYRIIVESLQKEKKKREEFKELIK